MPHNKVCLVIPSIRENCFQDFVDRWAGNDGLFHHVDVMLMEDNPTKTFNARITTHHYSWEDIDAELGDDSWIIPRRSDTVRSYGYLKAYEFGYEYILTLDDDCYPPTHDVDGLDCDGPTLVNTHLKYLNGRTKWFNTLNSVKPRGIPFYNLGRNTDVIVNHGLWTNVLDYDAPYQLANPVPEEFSYDNRIVPAGSYFPMCGMNVMWRREATVLMYHMLMGQVMTWDQSFEGPELVRLPFDRFGDIWCGIFMKKIADMFGKQVSSGMPYIRHERASNPFTNLKKEANGIEVNEKLWEYVDRFRMPVHVDNVNFAYAYSCLGAYIGEYNDFPEYRDYFRKLGAAMQIWASKFGGVR